MLVSGTVRIGPYGGTSKSARRHQAFLETVDGERLVLRLADGNPLRDPRLEALDGQRVEANGTLHGTLLIAEEVVPIAGTEKKSRAKRRDPDQEP